MPYSISDLKRAVSRKLHGTSANQLTDFYGLLYDVAVKCQEDCDFEETRRTVTLTRPLVPVDDYDYVCPEDLKGNRLIDLRPTDRSYGDLPSQLRSQDFDVLKDKILSGSEVEVRWNNGEKTLRLALPESDTRTYEIEYYSKYMFKDNTGTFKERPTQDNDLLNLDTDSYGVFTNCLAWFGALQQQGKDSGMDAPSYQTAYADSVKSYNQRAPSQAQKAVGSYYQVRSSSYASKMGGVTLRP